ncbi:hypothetical protein [Herbaspirillum chlorophenolicum]|uniref:hypothetical protein n=1 Tax=Herbaspirillum chlorophenolicum TaxID=211589 RepID=UPI00067BF854|nr:hypothetical protein [Herbaspirillum chlorophenolicum]
MKKINDFIRRLHRIVKPFCDLCGTAAQPLVLIQVLQGFSDKPVDFAPVLVACNHVTDLVRHLLQ